MAQTILVPLDGSPLAERALMVAIGLTQVEDRLVLLRVISEESSDQASTRPEAESYLAQVAQRLNRPDVTTVVASGQAAATILDEIARRRITLVVMSTHGRSGLGRWIYGSVADAVMRQVSIPLVLVSATCPLKPWPRERAPRILVTLDYSARSEAILAPAETLARVLGAELVLLSVTPMLMSIDGSGETAYLAYDVEQDEADRRAYLDRIAADVRATGLAVTTRVEFGFPVEEIARVATEEVVDLIALSTHGSGGMTRLVLGSVATGIVQRANVPILIVRPGKIPAGSEETVGSTAAPSPR